MRQCSSFLSRKPQYPAQKTIDIFTAAIFPNLGIKTA